MGYFMGYQWDVNGIFDGISMDLPFNMAMAIRSGNPLNGH